MFAVLQARFYALTKVNVPIYQPLLESAKFNALRVYQKTVSADK